MKCPPNWVIKSRHKGLSRKGFIGGVVGILWGDLGSNRTLVDWRKVVQEVRWSYKLDDSHFTPRVRGAHTHRGTTLLQKSKEYQQAPHQRGYFYPLSPHRVWGKIKRTLLSNRMLLISYIMPSHFPFCTYARVLACTARALWAACVRHVLLVSR